MSQLFIATVRSDLKVNTVSKTDTHEDSVNSDMAEMAGKRIPVWSGDNVPAGWYAKLPTSPIELMLFQMGSTTIWHESWLTDITHATKKDVEKLTFGKLAD